MPKRPPTSGTRRTASPRNDRVHFPPPAKRKNVGPGRQIDVSKIDFKTIESAKTSLDGLKITHRDVPQLFTAVHGTSATKALTLSKALLRREGSEDESEKDGRALIDWGAQGSDAHRQTVCLAFKQSRMDVLLVHGIGTLTRKNANQYMKSYFDAGGDVKAVAEWLVLVGNVLRSHEGKTPGTAGGVVKAAKGAANWVKHKAEDAVDAAGDAVNTVIDAVESAGKSVAEVVGAAANWTAGELADLAKALIKAGKKAAAVLDEALKKGMEVVGKFVKALVEAGAAAGAIMAWAVLHPAQVLRSVVGGLYKAGMLVGQILVNLVKNGPNIIRTALEGLFAVGLQLTEAVVAVCKNVAKGFQKGFFQGLIALGKAPIDILKAALKAGASVLALAFGVFLELWGGYRELTTDEKEDAKKIFGVSIELGRVRICIGNPAVDVIEWINGNRPFTDMYFVNFGSGNKVERGTLIHELTHVWQGVVSGPVYMVEALHSQFFGRGYNVTQNDLEGAAGDLLKLEREQQAVVVERYWRGKYDRGDSSWTGPLYEQLARQVYQEKRPGLVWGELVPIARRVTPISIRLTKVPA